jgi:hypothetical protein
MNNQRAPAMTRGTSIIDKSTGRRGYVLFAYPDGTEDQQQPWAKVSLGGYDDVPRAFTCRLMSELEVAA